MRSVFNPLLLAATMCGGAAVPAAAQTSVERSVNAGAIALNTEPSISNSDVASTLGFINLIQQPASAPPTPRHTGIKTMLRGLGTDVKHLPSRENLMWAGVGGGFALAAHPFDGRVNRRLTGNTTAEHVFKAGEILGELGTLAGSASAVYAVGRLRDEPKVSHVGMDLLRSLAISEGMTQTLKYTTRRERPDHSSRNSFPSGHAADTFAFATAMERHLGWRYAVPAYVFASYVAMSRMPANRHWLSDAVFGAAVGTIAGRTVTSREAQPYPVTVTYVPGGAAIMFARRGR